MALNYTSIISKRKGKFSVKMKVDWGSVAFYLGVFVLPLACSYLLEALGINIFS